MTVNAVKNFDDVINGMFYKELLRLNVNTIIELVNAQFNEPISKNENYNSFLNGFLFSYAMQLEEEVRENYPVFENDFTIIQKIYAKLLELAHNL